ncbi:MAG: CoA transferase [Bacillota bacterium]|nr:MAG: CoA transferase [Bacillota bacterium]
MPAASSPEAGAAPEGALSGIRVLDLSRVLAGPFCTALLADMGAEVIKVEQPGRGDDSRHFAPFRNGESGYFISLNRGKKSVTLNLKNPRAVELFKELTRLSDVVVENFKPGVLDKLGLGYRALAEVNPRIIVASISGFGQTGPYATRPAYDIVAQAMGGLMSITGYPDTPPTRVGESFGDLTAALYTAWAITAALYARDRLGVGQHIDVAMTDSVFSLLVTATCIYTYGGVVPGRVGNRHPISTPFDSFRAGDGHVIIAVANDEMFRRLAEAMGRPDLADDPRFMTDELRTRHEPELKRIIEEWIDARPVAEIVALLDSHSIPSSPILSVDQVLEGEHLAARGLVAHVEHPKAGRVPVVGQPVLMSGTPGRVRGPSPLLGEHTEEILAELLGMEPTEIEALRQEAAI